MNVQELIEIITEIRSEEKNLLNFIRLLNLSRDQKILDVGCGFGTKMELLRSHGFNVTGVDANKEIVEANIKAGMRCIAAADFDRTTEMYNVLLMSHVIEHFQPDSLLNFMDNYLDHLEIGGYLIISTPLQSPYFYDDFDHVKPYHPTGISMVFGGNEAQVQYYSRNKIELINIWFRKGPFKVTFAKGLYIDGHSRLPVIANLVMALLFRISGGLLGRTDGWMGLYKKTGE